MRRPSDRLRRGSGFFETTGLKKTFYRARSLRRPFHRPKSTKAVDGVDLHVRRGELFGLVGPNGAGKTTLIKLLCTLIVPTAGTARVMNLELSQETEIKSKVGLVVSDERSFYWRLTARQNLEFFATMVGIEDSSLSQRVSEVLEAVELSSVADRRFSNFSTGMRQRLAIARGLLHRPQLLFMDEPTRSLDPNATGHLHQLIHALVQREGMTVLLTTHNLTEVEALCDRVAVMHHGRIQACARPDQLRRQLSGASSTSYSLTVDRWEPGLAQRLKPLVTHFQADLADDESWRLNLQLRDNSTALSAVLDTLRSADLTIQHIQSELPSLGEVFAHYTQEIAS